MSVGRPSGVQDTAGWGLLGLTVGILAGFAVGLYLVVPLFPKTSSIPALTVMTTLTVVAMAVGGGLGYLLTRRRG